MTKPLYLLKIKGLKPVIDFLGKPTFVCCTWILLILFSIWCIFIVNDKMHWAIQFILSFILYFGTMAFGFFYFQAFPAHRIWLNYYTPKSFESMGLYKLLGVELYRRILIKSPFRKLNQRVYLRGRKEYVTIFHEETKRSETSHLIGFLIGLFFTVYFFYVYNKTQGYLSIFFNLVMNVYPILLQRYNRIKIPLPQI